MSLIKLRSDKGRGYMSTVVYLDSAQIAKIVPVTDQYSRSDNHTIITLNSGATEFVIETVEEVAKLAGGVS